MYKIFFTLFITCSSIAQNNVIATYDVTYNTFRPTTKKATLLTNDTATLYIEGQNSKKIADSNPVEGIFSVQYAESTTYNYTDLRKDSLYSKVSIQGKNFHLKETKPALNWTLIDEQKKVNSYTVKKATLSFRGRDYIAWYSENLPISAGPWKFSGLPGLIFQVYDVSRRYSWDLTKLTIISSGDNDFNLPTCTDCQIINLKTYCYLYYEKDIDKGSSLRNLQRGENLTVTRPPRNGKETKFEWEH